MEQCEVCGNKYHSPLIIEHAGEQHSYDCFECAIEGLAPRCNHCGCAVIGHGVEDRAGIIYCCARCQREVERYREEAA